MTVSAFGGSGREKINKYMIPEQSFDVTLDGWGEVLEADSLPWSPR